MSEYRPPNNKNGKKPTYHSVPVRKKSNIQSNIKSNAKSGGKSSGVKYRAPKRQKIPTPVIITNILMIGVILAICGVVFAIAYNNIKYDKADASKSSKPVAAVTSNVQSAVGSTAQNTNSAATSNAENSAAANSEENSAPVVAPTGDYDAEFFKDDLFIGDSIFTGLYGYSYLEHRNVAAAVGYTAYGAQTNAFDENFYQGSAVDYAKSMQPKRIIIMLGSNGLSPQTDLDDFKDSYRGLLNTLRRDCPNSVICVVSVPPITEKSSMASYSGITNTIIDKANVILKSLSNDLGLLYYDLNSALKDENGYFDEKYAELDGMHFLGSTYPVLLSGVQEVFEQQ